MNEFVDIEGRDLFVGDTVAIHYDGYTIPAIITAFTARMVKVRVIGDKNHFWYAFTFTKKPSKLLKIRL